MGGKTGTTTQSVQIPPEVLARYNSVNTQAQQTAAQPFQQYSTDPNAFVAPLNQQQLTGISNINQYANAAQPGYQAGYGATDAAMQAIQGGQNVAQPYFQGAQTMAAGVLPQYQQAAGLAGAAMTPLQQATYAAQPSYQTAQAGTMGAANQLGGISQGYNAQNYQQGVAGYMNPFVNQAMGATANYLQNQNQQQQQQLQGNAISQGAFGGDRGNIAQAALMGQQNLAMGNTLSNMANQGYQNAAQNYMSGLGQQANIAAQQGALANQYGQLGGQAQQALINAGQAQQQGAANIANIAGQGMAGANQYGALGTAAQNAALQSVPLSMAAGAQYGQLGAGAQAAGLQGAQAQLGAGTLGQQTQQAGNTALYNQFLQQQAYPFQVSQFLANIAEGTGALSGSTTTTNQPMPFFSDRRLKHDIKRIGESDHGLPIYAFKYKHDPEGHTHVGFMADEVEHVHPEAVGLAGGYKTVDYDKIANDNGRSEGGMVGPQHEGSGFMAGGREHHAYGSAVGSDYNPYDPNSIQNIVARQQAGLASGENSFVPAARQLANATGKASRVPLEQGPHYSLLRAEGNPAQHPTGMEQTMGGLKTAETIADLFKNNPKTGDKGFAAMLMDKMGMNKSQNADQNTQQNQSQNPAPAAPAPTPPVKTPDTQHSESEIPLPPMRPEGLASADFAPGDDLTATTGGRMHRSLGGGDTPYADDSGGKLDIPDEKNQHALMTAQNPTGSTSQTGLGVGDALALAKGAASAGSALMDFLPMLMAAKGGRMGHATTGTVSDDENLPNYLNALGKIESGGNYGALGPTTKRGDRAYGKYQVMGSNVGPWTQEALGKAMTPDDFLADKNAQEAVANHYFGQALSKYGTPQDAASVWFTGKPLAKTTQQTADITGTTVPKYLQRFNKAAGLGQVAGLDQIGGGGDDTQQPSWFHPEVADSYKALPGSNQYAEADLPTATKQVGGTEDTTPAAPPAATPTGGLAPNEGYEAAKKALNPPSVWSEVGKGLGVPEKYQDSNLWIPALAGLGSMLSSKSPYLLPALGEGLVGGAAAYSQLQPQQAQTEQTRAETMAVLQGIPRENFLPNGDVLVEGPDGKPIPMGAQEYSILKLTHPEQVKLWNYGVKGGAGTARGLAGAAGDTGTATGLGGTKTPPVAPLTGDEKGVIDAEDPMALSDDEKKAVAAETIQLAGKYRKPDGTPDLASLQTVRPNLTNTYRQAALDAAPVQKNNGIYADILTSRDDHELTGGGKYAEWFEGLRSTLDDISRKFGGSGYHYKEGAALEEAQKIYAQNLDAAQKAGDNQTVGKLNILAKTYPWINNTQLGSAKNMAQIMTNTQMPIDQNRLARNMVSSTGGVGKWLPESEYVGENFADQYNRRAQPLQAKEATVLEKMMTTPPVTASADPIKDPETGKPMPTMFSFLQRYGDKLSGKQLKAIAAEFGADPSIFRYFPRIRTQYAGAQ